MIYVYAKYQKPTPYIKRDIANVKVFTTPAGRMDGRTAGRNRHYIDSHCIACESITGLTFSFQRYPWIDSVTIFIQCSVTFSGTYISCVTFSDTPI